MEHKSDSASSLLRFLRMVEVQHGVNVAIVHVDNDTVLINQATKTDLAMVGTVFEPSTTYTAHQNGVAESSNRVGEARTRLMMVRAPHIPKSMWPYASRYAIKIMNHCPTTAIPSGKTRRQLLLEFMNIPNPVPNLYALRKFDKPGWVHIPEQRRAQGDKFLPRATKQYFVGREGSRIYLTWDPDTKKVTRTSSVKWIAAPLREITDVNNNSTPAPTGLRSTIPSPSPSPESTPPTSELSSLVPQAGGEDKALIMHELDVLQLPEAGQCHDFDGLVENAWLDDGRHDSPQDSPVKALRHRDIAADLDERSLYKRSASASLQQRPQQSRSTLIPYASSSPARLLKSSLRRRAPI
jgi:hypothetical protein